MGNDEVKDSFEFFIEMPCRLNRKDLISFDRIIDEKKFSDWKLDILYNLSFIVNFISFDSDREGIYQKAFIIGK